MTQMENWKTRGRNPSIKAKFNTIVLGIEEKEKPHHLKAKILPGSISEFC